MNKKWLVMLSFAFIFIMLSGCNSTNDPSHETDHGQTGEDGEGAQESEEQAWITQEEVNDFLRLDEELYEKYWQYAKEGAIIPALLQDYVPQGITLLENEEWVVISNYSSVEGKATILTVIDNETDKFVKAVELHNADNTPYTGHAGGITVSKQFLWVASGSKVRRIAIEDLVKAEDHASITFQDEFTVDSRASFVYYHDEILWVGDYAFGTKYPTPETHHMKNRQGQDHIGWVAGYHLDAESESIVNSEDAATAARPDYILSIPVQIQGMAITEDNIILSQSYGRSNTSKLLLYVNEFGAEPHSYLEHVYDQKVPIWFVDEQSLAGELVMPPMSETLVFDAEKLYVLFESGANAYRVSGAYPLLRLQTIEKEQLSTLTNK